MSTNFQILLGRFFSPLTLDQWEYRSATLRDSSLSEVVNLCYAQHTPAVYLETQLVITQIRQSSSIFIVNRESAGSGSRGGRQCSLERVHRALISPPTLITLSLGSTTNVDYFLKVPGRSAIFCETQERPHSILLYYDATVPKFTDEVPEGAFWTCALP